MGELVYMDKASTSMLVFPCSIVQLKVIIGKAGHPTMAHGIPLCSSEKVPQGFLVYMSKVDPESKDIHGTSQPKSTEGGETPVCG